MTKKNYFILIVLLIIIPMLITDSYAALKDFVFQPQIRTLIFVEDYYALYRRNLYHNTDAHLANIYYLKTALIKAESNRWWAHPVKVFSYAGYNWTSSRQPYTEAHHAKYKELMKMRLALLLTKSYLALGARYDKENIYWFNADDIENTTENTTEKARENTTENTNKKDHYLVRGFRIARVCYLEAYKYFFRSKEYVRILLEDKYVNDRLYKEGILYSKINLEGPELDSMEDEAYKIFFGGSMIEADPIIKDKKINLKMDKEKYMRKVRLYKEEKKFYNKENYPEYNYSKVIKDKLDALSFKEERLKKLIDSINQSLKK